MHYKSSQEPAEKCRRNTPSWKFKPCLLSNQLLIHLGGLNAVKLAFGLSLK